MNIDYNACSMDDVIRRSLLLHPSLFAEAMDKVAAIHGAAFLTVKFRDCEAGRMAAKMAGLALDMAAWAREESLNVDTLGFSGRVMAFNTACQLQALPRNVAQSIAAREG